MLQNIKYFFFTLFLYLPLCLAQPTTLYLQNVYLGNGLWQDSTIISIENGIIQDISTYDSIPAQENILDFSAMTALPGLVFPFKKIDLDSSFNSVKFLEIDKIKYDWPPNIVYTKLGICTYLYYSLNSKNQLSTIELYPKNNLASSPIGIIGNNFGQFAILELYNDVRNYGEFLIYNYVDEIRSQHFVNYKMKNLLLKNIFGDIKFYLIIENKNQTHNLVKRFYRFNIDYIVSHKLLNELSNTNNSQISAVLFENASEYAKYLNSTEDTSKCQYVPIIKNYVDWISALSTIEKKNNKELFIDALTNIPSKYFGIDNFYGNIQVGKKANLLFFSKNPLDKQQNIVSVMVNGKIITE